MGRFNLFNRIAYEDVQSFKQILAASFCVSSSSTMSDFELGSHTEQQYSRVGRIKCLYSSEVHDLMCTDEVDESASTHKWNKKAAESLEKLNKDCNMTAGLEAKLSLAVGARVMLRHNIDTKAGLVNGALGTVLSITLTSVTVQFDHIHHPHDVERVKSRFMVMKNFISTEDSFH